MDSRPSLPRHGSTGIRGGRRVARQTLGHFSISNDQEEKRASWPELEPAIPKAIARATVRQTTTKDTTEAWCHTQETASDQ